MPNIWRRQPSNRLSSYNLVKKEASSQSVTIANLFFEVTLPPVITETIVANEFPMGYYQTTGVKELRSKVSGATITEVAKNFPPILQKAGKAKELVSKWS